MAKRKNKKDEMTVSVQGADGEFKESKILTDMMNGVSSETNTPGVTKEIVIKKIKIDPDEFLYVEYSHHIVQTDGIKRKDQNATIKYDGENKIHEDVKNAFAKLNPHIGLIAEMIETSETSIEDINDNAYHYFDVKGIVLSEDGIILTGTKMLSTGKMLNLVTPMTKWDDSEYKFMSELGETIEECKHEAQEYLNGKMAPAAQQELDLKVEAEIEKLEEQA